MDIIGNFISTYAFECDRVVDDPIISSRVLSESVRWLINKKRYNEAEQVILKMAKANGKTVPPHLLIAPTDEEVLGASTQGLESTRNLCEKPPAAETAFDALRNRSLWKRLAILVIAW